MKRYFQLVGALLFLVLILAAAQTGKAQTNLSVSDTLKGWDFSWIGGINGSQAAYNNWSQGGVNTISATGSNVFIARYRKEKFSYAFSTNLKYGKAKLSGEGTRKTDDKIALRNKFGYRLDDTDFSAYGNVGFETQFDKGYDYSGEQDVLISRFMAPLYMRQDFGIAYNPTDFFGIELGAGFKETIVRDTTLSTRYGLDAGSKFRFEPGFTYAMNFEKEVVQNVILSSSFETFTNPQYSLKYTDISFTNELVGKINSYLNATLQFVMIYDRDFSTEVQTKQVLSAGISYNFM